MAVVAREKPTAVLTMTFQPVLLHFMSMSNEALSIRERYAVVEVSAMAVLGSELEITVDMEDVARKMM